MSKICKAAEDKATELGRSMTPYTRAKLSTMDDDAQVRWIVNPFMEWMIERATNEILAGPVVVVDKSNNKPNPAKPITKSVAEPAKSVESIKPVKPVVKPVVKPESESDGEIIGGGLFD